MPLMPAMRPLAASSQTLATPMSTPPIREATGVKLATNDLPPAFRYAIVNLHLFAGRYGDARGGAHRPGVRAGAARRGAGGGARPEARLDARDARARRSHHRRMAAAREARRQDRRVAGRRSSGGGPSARKQ